MCGKPRGRHIEKQFLSQDGVLHLQLGVIELNCILYQFDLADTDPCPPFARQKRQAPRTTDNGSARGLFLRPLAAVLGASHD